ncbi:MAG TPA: methyl-accepting chemotaxis protein [Sphingomonas sp.]|jgi:methyl-accepting chemotaxis protein|uniref:methyl-accepting chemotaxis protein n=1 Tax=Sphingomonas sp. TaxID=28214 RepID=UPI002ED9D78E
MLKWFRETALIRTKMRLLNVTYTGFALGSAACVALVDPASKSTLTTIAFAIAGLVAVIGIVTARAITEPYVATVVRMEALAQGDLSSPIHFGQHQDCVGRMTRAMQVFRTTAAAQQKSETVQGELVTMMGQSLHRMAQGDLSVRLDTPFSEENEPLRHDFNAAVAAMAETLGAVTSAASAINTGANEISQASDDLSRRTEQQAASLQQTAAAMDEITVTVRETAAGAVRANEVVAATRNDAEDGGRIVREAVDAMGGIERASSEISEIISVIDGIAFQTNLLALNAGVEAARAGDAGRGFAVVASEVRALAQRSADAAKDVKTKITASTGQVDIGVALVGETGRALERIVGRIAEVSTLVSSIASSAEQQAQGLQQVNTAVGEMDSVTQQNAAMVEESTAAARNLATESDDLARHVARFTLATGQATRRAPNVHQMPAVIEKPAPARRAATPARMQGALALKIETSPDDWSSF